MKDAVHGPGRPDAEIVLRVRDGDREAYDDLVRRYHALVYALAYRVLDEVHAAEDVSQEAFLKAFVKIDTLGQPDRFAPWLKQIALRECWAWAGRLKRREAIQAQATAAAAPVDPLLDALAAEEEDEWIENVRRTIEVLSDRQCQFLDLYYVRGLSHESISDFLGVPRGTVKRRMFDARQELRSGSPLREQFPADREFAARFLEAFLRALEVRTQNGDPDPSRGEDHEDRDPGRRTR